MTGPIESRLTAALGELRPIGPVPAVLRERVLAMPERHRGWSSAGRLGRLRLVLASTATVVVLLAIWRVPSLSSPLGGVQTTPPAAGVDPSIEGPGVITSMVPTLPIVGAAAVVGLLLLAVAGIRRNPRRRTGTVAAVLALAVALGVVGLLMHPGPGDAGWNGFGPVLGFRQIDTPGTTDEEGQHLETLFEAAKPGEPFAVVFVVGNPGVLPVRLEGVLEDPDAASRIAPRWTQLAVGTDPNAIGQPLDQVASFVPTDIAPGGYVTLYLIGKASPCAIGAEPYAPDQAFAVRGPDIELAYSILGLRDTSTYHMPLVIEEPIRSGCTG